MDAPLTTRVSLLQTLRDGPGYGQDLIRRVHRSSGGALRLSGPRVYTTLHALLVEGLITGRRVSPKGARGARARTYYELTPRGIAISSNQRRALARMIDRGGAQPPDENERGRMAARLREACALSEFGGALERAMRKAR